MRANLRPSLSAISSSVSATALPHAGAFARGGAGFVEAADHIARTLIDGLTAAILFDLPTLILSQEQRQCLRCRQHGKLRGQRAGEVAAKLQRILFATAVGVSVPLSLRENFSKATKILCDVSQDVAGSDTLQESLIFRVSSEGCRAHCSMRR